jgi:tRNA nucleotidyltransferase/poly(A) polymerase
MDEAAIARHVGEDAHVVGGAVRDELLGRPVLDLDVACRDPEAAARTHADATGGALFPLSERHGAWRVAFRDGRTVDFTPLRDGLEADLRTRDFTVNAIARPLGSRELLDPLGGVPDLERRTLRAVTPGVFRDDPLRLLRAVRLEDELGFRLDEATERLVRRDAELVIRPAGERILGELARLSENGFRRLDELGLLAPLGGSLERLDAVESAGHPDFLLVVVLGEALFRLPVSNETRRFARRLLAARAPEDGSPRAVHRFRRATEPWALEALAYLGRGAAYAAAVEDARARDPAEPLLRGDELGVSPGPEVGRLLRIVEEERAAGTISTREEALALVRRAATRRPT